MSTPAIPAIKTVLQELLGRTVANACKMNMDPLALGVFTLEQAQITLESIRQAELVQAPGPRYQIDAETLSQVLGPRLDKHSAHQGPRAQRKLVTVEATFPNNLAESSQPRVRTTTKREK